MRIGNKIILLMVAVLFVACRTKPKDKFTDTPTSGVIPVSVDQSFQPIISQEINVFEGIYSLAGIVPRYCSEVEAVSLLLKDSVRLAITTRMLTAQEQESFKSRKFFPREVKIALDGMALIVNNENQDTLISIIDLQKVMTGEVTDWKTLDSRLPKENIELVFDHPNSSTVRFAIDSVCRGKKLSDRLWAGKSDQGVINYVARTPQAMGIVGVSWLQNPEDSTRLSFLKKVKVMAVSKADKATESNSYQPWLAYLATGEYPLTRSVYAILTDPRNGLASGFTSFLASDRGQRIILKAGLVPVTQPIRIVNVREKL